MNKTDFIRPELDRNEYLRLLSVARSRGKERLYLIIKTIASTGIMIEELPNLTVETLQKGYLEILHGQVQIPDFLCRELSDYVSRKGIVTGMVFRTRGGLPIDRSNLNHAIKALSEEAHLSERKCTPRCLRQLYQRTQKKIRDEVEMLVEQEFCRIMENEQSIIGWDT